MHIKWEPNHLNWNYDTLHDKTAAYTLSDKKKSHVNRVNSSGSVKLQNLTFRSKDSVQSRKKKSAPYKQIHLMTSRVNKRQKS